jgi:uncharacterized protein YkwD
MKRFLLIATVLLAAGATSIQAFEDRRAPAHSTQVVTIPASEISFDLPAEISPASVLAGMNRYRAEAGLPPLLEEPRLEAVANDRMRDMEDLAYWGHVAPDGRTPFLLYRPHGYTFSNAGENLARGFETTALLVKSWMESKGHRANIMSPVYRDCGVSVIDGATTGPATGKSIVVVFGSELTPRASSGR